MPSKKVVHEENTSFLLGRQCADGGAFFSLEPLRKNYAEKARILLAAGMLAMPFVAIAQDGIASAVTAPLEGQFKMTFEDGTVAVADYSTQRIYITKTNGLNFEVTFADTIAIEPDPVKREALSTSFQQSLVDPTNMVAIKRVRVATDSSYWPKPSKGDNPPDDTNVEQKANKQCQAGYPGLGKW